VYVLPHEIILHANSLYKAFLASFSRGIALEYSSGVDVLLVEPGSIADTNFQQTAGQPAHPGHSTAEGCVFQSIEAMKEHPGGLSEIVPHTMDKLTALAMKFFPNSIILPLTTKRGKKYAPKELL